MVIRADRATIVCGWRQADRYASSRPNRVAEGDGSASGRFAGQSPTAPHAAVDGDDQETPIADISSKNKPPALRASGLSSFPQPSTLHPQPYLLYGRSLNIALSCVCFVSSGIGRPSMKRYFVSVFASRMSPVVTTTFAILPTSSDPILSPTPKICAGQSVTDLSASVFDSPFAAAIPALYGKVRISE